MKKLYYLDEKIYENKESWLRIKEFLSVLIKNEKDVNLLCSLIIKSCISFSHFFLATYIYKKSLEKHMSRESSPRREYKVFISRIKEESTQGLMQNLFLVFTIALIISSKVLEDAAYSNLCWSELCLIPCSKINSGEKYILNLLNWEMIPKNKEFISLVSEFELVNQNSISFAPKNRFVGKERTQECCFPLLRCLGL